MDAARGHTSIAAVDGARAQRLAGLDGIRGLAAVFVVVNHVFLRAFPGYPVDRAPFWGAWFIYGRFAVVVFIVLSGFSLALGPARHGWRLDGIGQFARRRARRILPAYWAALVFSLAVAWLIVSQPGRGVPDAKSVLVNGLLVQNIVGAHSPNAAFWSMAVEAQLYLAFPLLLLMVRRWGAIAMVATVALPVSMVGVYGPHVTGLDTLVIQSAPDLAALFALGILAAGVVRAGAARRSWPWGWLALGAGAPVLAAIWWQGSVWTLGHLFWADLALGPAIACLLAAMATGHAAPLRRLLDTRPMRALGASSYSLYLTHAPIVVVIYEEFVARRFHPGAAAFLVTLAVALPVTILFAGLFAAVFETRSGRAHAIVRRMGGWLGIRRRTWTVARVAGPPVTLAIMVWRLGTGPFLDGLRTIHATPLAAAGGLTVLTTVCSAWRWKLVAGALGIELPLGTAVAAYYRALFLNVTLPGGVVGDVHRAVRHGRDVRDVNAALRSVVWERFGGQIVQGVLTVVALLALPSPVRSAMRVAAPVAGAALIGVALVARASHRRCGSKWARVTRVVSGDIRAGLLARTVWPGVALASAVAVAGHAITFLIAARTAGVSAPASQMIPIALLVMAAMVLPSVGGWGPREGGAAWLFAAAGLGAQRGVAAAVVYGVMVLVASLPGAVVLVVTSARAAGRAPRRNPALAKRAVHA